MPVRFGADEPAKFYFGADEVDKLYLGADEIYSRSQPVPRASASITRTEGSRPSPASHNSGFSPAIDLDDYGAGESVRVAWRADFQGEQPNQFGTGGLRWIDSGLAARSGTATFTVAQLRASSRELTRGDYRESTSSSNRGTAILRLTRTSDNILRLNLTWDGSGGGARQRIRVSATIN